MKRKKKQKKMCMRYRPEARVRSLRVRSLSPDFMIQDLDILPRVVNHQEVTEEEEDQKEEIELEFVEIKTDLLISILHKNHSISLILFANQIRTSFVTDIYWDQLDLQIKIADVNITDLIKIETDKKFLKEFKIAIKKIWNAHPCLHCKLILFEEIPICKLCESLSIITYKDKECIICKESIHPIVFRCRTCIDSQICISCEQNRIRKECEICHTKPHIVKLA